jgi:hypothetical protein
MFNPESETMASTGDMKDLTIVASSKCRKLSCGIPLLLERPQALSSFFSWIPSFKRCFTIVFRREGTHPIAGCGFSVPSSVFAWRAAAVSRI